MPSIKKRGGRGGGRGGSGTGSYGRSDNGGRGGRGSDELAAQCMVTTYVGSGARETEDGVGTAARVGDPIAICFSKAGNALVVNQYAGILRRITLPATCEMKASLVQSVIAGLALVAGGGAGRSLSQILPLIELIVSYAVALGGTNRLTPPLLLVLSSPRSAFHGFLFVDCRRFSSAAARNWNWKTR